MKKLWNSTAALLLLSAILAGCGGGGGGESAPATPPAATPPVVAPPVVAPPVVAPPVVAPPVVAPPVVSPPAPSPDPLLPYAIPTGLWSAPSGAAPASGNYIYLESPHGDYIGGGRTYVHTNADTQMTYTASGLRINATVRGNHNWQGEFLLPSAALTLQAGYFKDLTRTPFANPAVGGVEWTGNGRGCNTIKGWVIIDKIVLTNGVLELLDLRFEQACDGGVPLHGQLHWNKADVNNGVVTAPAAIPATLWRAPAGAVPASGNYVYLESASGDYVGAGRTYNYTQANSILRVTPSGALIGVSVAGDQRWDGSFIGMQGLSQLAVGYYPGLTRYPFHNPVLGGMSWSGDGRGCNTLTGWFVIDKITYNGSVMTELEMRFQQHCEGGSNPLRGQIRWTSTDNVQPPGPLSPPPANLWRPAATFVPPAGNYIYLVSDAGDYIGGGRTELLTPTNSTFNVTSNLTAALQIGAGGWSGDFFAMQGLSQLQPGYYGDLQRYPFHNAVKGGLNWSGNGRGCNTLTGWFVVDSVSYSLGQMTAIDLRFEQHCEGGAAAQRGVIHWVK